MSQSTSYGVSRFAAIADRSSFAKPVLLSLFLKTPCQVTNECHLAKFGGRFSVFLHDLSTAFGD